MAVEGIANLVQNFADQLFAQRQDKQAGTNTFGTGRAGNARVTEDTFTPSGQNNSATTAQDAGIFHLSQVAMTEVTANFLFEQVTPNGNQSGAPAPGAPAPTTNAGSAQTAAPNSGAPGNEAQQVAANPAEQSATGPAAATDVKLQLQALNEALPALGLTNAEIQQIDRIAALIKDFNPAAYTDLVTQFEAIAQQAAQQGAANSPVIVGATPIPNTVPGTNGGGFQVQEVLIHFTDLQGTVNTAATNNGGQGSTANNVQVNAASLQIEQVQFTLTNGNGQTVQVQAPQQNTNA